MLLSVIMLGPKKLGEALQATSAQLQHPVTMLWHLAHLLEV